MACFGASIASGLVLRDTMLSDASNRFGLWARTPYFVRRPGSKKRMSVDVHGSRVATSTSSHVCRSRCSCRCCFLLLVWWLSLFVLLLLAANGYCSLFVS